MHISGGGPCVAEGDQLRQHRTFRGGGTVLATRDHLRRDNPPSRRLKVGNETKINTLQETEVIPEYQSPFSTQMYADSTLVQHFGEREGPHWLYK